MNHPGIPLVIDTDPALGIWHEARPRDVDDGLANIEAINHPQVDLLGITVTFGNAPLADAVDVARKLVALKSAEVPVFAGASGAMPEAGIAPTNDAVEFLADITAEKKIRIAAIGPLTNLGTLLTRYPDRARNIEEVVIVAGRTAGRHFYIGSTGPVRDFNFENDVRAAQILLAAGIPIVMAGFELSSAVAITAQDLQQIKAHGTPSAEFLFTNSIDWFEHWTTTFSEDDGFHPWDSAALAWIVNPGVFTTEQRGFRIRPQPLSASEQANLQARTANPDDSPAVVDWLETAPEFDGPKVTYCTGFKDGQRQPFIDAVVAGIY